MLGLKLNHVSKRGPSPISEIWAVTSFGRNRWTDGSMKPRNYPSAPMAAKGNKTHRSAIEYHHQRKRTPAPGTLDSYFAWHICMRPVLITNNLHEIQKNMQSDQVTKKDADICLVWTYGHYACSIEWVGMIFCHLVFQNDETYIHLGYTQPGKIWILVMLRVIGMMGRWTYDKTHMRTLVPEAGISYWNE